MAKKEPVLSPNEIDLEKTFNENFLQYSAYVIKERAILDIDDGLKPVQRRVLTTLFRNMDGRYHKSANIVGQTMPLHPHGDSSIGGALNTLAQKEYLIDKQGNFGAILTGDDPAAARYTECKASKLAERILWNPDITNFIPSYDGRNTEPVVLPAKVPLALLLGSEGIAVGMAAKILPHNWIETIEAVKETLRGKKIKGVLPDFPLGGIIDVSEYEDGNGKIKVRAKLDLRDEKKIVIRELPYGSSTESMLASIEKAAHDKKINISSVDDYTSDVCEIEIKLPRGVYAKDILNSLYAYTDCEISISANMLVIQDGDPVQTTTTKVIKRSADNLIKLLTAELELEQKELQDKKEKLELEDIFITKGVYKKIEGLKTKQEIFDMVRKEMKKCL
jgi:topoisomerase-4 subunit A